MSSRSTEVLSGKCANSEYENEASRSHDIFQQALCFHREGEIDEAICLYQMVVDEDPENIEAFFYGALIFTEIDQHDKALLWLDRAHKLNPTLPVIAYQLGVCQFAQGQNHLAIKSFQKVLDVDCEHWQAAYNLGAAYFSAGQISEAIEAYSEAARLNPQDGDIFFNLGLAYKNAGDFEKSRDAYVTAMEIVPDDADVHYNLGRLYNEMGRKKDAITSLEIAIAIQPDFGAALTNLGVLYTRQGLEDKAIKVYQKLVDIEYNPIAAQHILNALKGKTTDSAPLLYIKDLYDDFAGHFDKRLVGDLSYDVPRMLVNSLHKYGDKKKTYKRMLDLGCGTGLCGQSFGRIADSITGVDLSDKMIEKARQKGCYEFLIQNDIISFLEEVSEPYDLIVAGDVLIYLGELESVFQLLPKCLLENGRILLSTEQFHGKGYTLCSSGRYAHSTSYITNLAIENDLQVLAVESVNSRKENDQWIAGDIFLIGHAR